MRILTYNLHKGFSAGNRRFELARMRDALRTTEAEVIFLQEVQGAHMGHGQTRADFINEAQAEYLADQVWPHHAYGRNAVYNLGHHGNAILSKWPLKQVENIDLTITSFERRGVIHAVIEPDGFPTPVHLLCTHLDLSGFTRAPQIARITARIAEHIPADAPVILAGDFNDWRSQVHRAIEGQLGLREAHGSLYGQPARTFPSWRPWLRLDRVYVRHVRPTYAQRMVGGSWVGLSDHCALMVDLSPESSPPPAVSE